MDGMDEPRVIDLALRALGDEPIRLGLYFPLLSAWREWAAEEGDRG